MAATFYAEPVLTYDLDVFISLPESSGLSVLSPIDERLRAKGLREEGECVAIHGVPVRFLPAFNDLLEEALRESRGVTYEDVPTRVLSVEHLIAICHQTGRVKDRDRVRLMRQEAELDKDRLKDIIRRHHLETARKAWTS